ncbi:MAG TPA: ABC transporter ATP-binding protein [Nitrososphaeraceae archaeon]|jgi:ABC-2 type transport system ATP-binding protein|nr:ABC transporter ATP-binding protein [Nitrososphaeraceae archaeon]
MHAIEAIRVSKAYKGSTYSALNNVSLNVETKQIFTILGRNGVGKTTFIRICATQLMPSAGTVYVLGYDILKEPSKIRNIVSIVPQEGRPLRALTPWDHVYNWLQIRGEDKKAAREKTEKILHKLELYEAKDRPAMNLSGGMKQKVLVAMAMATNAQLLFLDEPTIGLDPVSRRQVWSAIKDWKKQGGSILLTTHYMDEAEMLSDNIVIIDNGHLMAQGTMRDLRRFIPQNIRVDIAKDGIDTDILKSYGSIVDTGTDTIRLLTFESTIRELSEFAIKRSLSFTISPITLDDVFVSLVGNSVETVSHDAAVDYKTGN